MAKDKYGYESTPETHRRFGEGPLYTPVPPPVLSSAPCDALDVRNGWRGFGNQGGVDIRLRPESTRRQDLHWTLQSTSNSPLKRINIKPGAR